MLQRMLQAADIQLTPYDIIRLKDNLGISGTEFLKNHTVPFEMDKDGMPGVKLRTDNDGACLFVTDEGCSVYADRPTACRYYPVGHMAVHMAGTTEDELVSFWYRRTTVRDMRKTAPSPSATIVRNSRSSSTTISTRIGCS